MYQGDKNENSKTGVYRREVEGWRRRIWIRAGTGVKREILPCIVSQPRYSRFLMIIYLTIILVLKNSLLDILYHTFVKNASIFGIFF